MSLDVAQLKKILTDAGIEVFRTRSEEIHVAERVRLHIMDSGVRVGVSGPTVRFTARSQKSDFPSASDQELLDKVREVIGARALERGYRETDTSVNDVPDPGNPERVLDVWHEITFEKGVDALEGLVDEVRWAVELEKYASSS